MYGNKHGTKRGKIMNEYELLFEIDDNIKRLLRTKKNLSKKFRQLKKYRKDVLKLCKKNSKIPSKQIE